MSKEQLKEYLCWLVDKDYIRFSNINCMVGIFFKFKNKYIFEKRTENLKKLLG